MPQVPNFASRWGRANLFGRVLSLKRHDFAGLLVVDGSCHGWGNKDSDDRGAK